jgi:hypothetical protein
MDEAAAPAGTRRFTPPITLDTLLAGALLLAGAIVFLWYAPGSYQVYLAAAHPGRHGLVGGDITLTTLGIVFDQKRDGPTLAALGRMGTWIGTRVYTPALFFVFAFGVALVEKSGTPWDQFWVIFGVASWAAAMTIGIGLRRTRARPDRPSGSGVRAGVTRGREARQAPVHDLPLRHGAARPRRAGHGGEADVLGEF